MTTALTFGMDPDQAAEYMQIRSAAAHLALACFRTYPGAVDDGLRDFDRFEGDKEQRCPLVEVFVNGQGDLSEPRRALTGTYREHR